MNILDRNGFRFLIPLDGVTPLLLEFLLCFIYYLFHIGVPLSAYRAFADPFGRLITTILAEKN